MATLVASTTWKDMNVSGDRVEDVFSITMPSGVTSGFLQTRLSWIEHVDIITRGGGDMVIVAYRNSSTALTTDPNPGYIFLSGLTDEQATYQIRVTGY